MSTSKLLQSLVINEPCSASWDEMKGNDQARLCEHCSFEVKDLSQFTRAEAVRMALRSKGRICLRIHKTPAGEVITREVTQKIHAISRRASRIAAGAFTAVMSVSAAGYAPASDATSTGDVRPVAEASLPTTTAEGGAWLGGKVTDSNGALVPGAKITLRNESSNEIKEVVANEDGTFGLWVDHVGPWEVKAESPGFASYTLMHVELSTSGNTQVELALQPSGVENGIVLVTTEYEQPLVKAAYKDDLPTVTALLRSGTPANQAEEDGTTALFLAVGHGNLEMIQLLLDAGADATATNENGSSVLFWVDRENGGEILDRLINAGANVNQANEEGNTPLIIAALSNDGEFIQVLLEHGAFIDAQNREGASPLMMAAEYDNDDAVKALLKAGANVSLRNAEGEDALQLAVESENEEICELLRAAGAEDPTN